MPAGNIPHPRSPRTSVSRFLMRGSGGVSIPFVARQPKGSDRNPQGRDRRKCGYGAAPDPLGFDTKEHIRLRGCLQVEVEPADDAFRVARLQCGLAERAELGHEHRNERVPHDIVGEREFLRHLFAEVLEVCRDDRKLLQRILPQPGREVRLMVMLRGSRTLDTSPSMRMTPSASFTCSGLSRRISPVRRHGRMPANRHRAKKGTAAG